MAVTVVGTAIANLGINTREWITGLNEAQKRFVSFGAAMQVTGFRLGVVLAATFGAPALAVTKFGASFEKAFAGVRKTVEGSEKQFSQLSNTLRETAKNSTFTYEQLADLARIGGQLGVGVADLGKFTDSIAKLAIAAAELPAEEAAVGLARLINITQSSMKDIDIYASVLAKLGDSFATTESRILNFSERIAGLAEVVNMTATDALALGAAFTATVPGVELVATQLSKGMAIFAQAVAEGGDKLRVLDQLVQHTGQNFATLFRVDAANAIAQFLSGLGKLSQSDAFGALRELGLTNQRAAQAFLAAAGSANQFTRAIAESRREVGLARTEYGKLETTFREQMKPIASQWEKLKNNFKDAMYEIFIAWRNVIEGAINVAQSLISVIRGVAAVFAILPDSIKAATGAAITLLAAFAALSQIGGMAVSVVVPLQNISKAMLSLVTGATAANAVLAAQNTAVAAQSVTMAKFSMATTAVGTAATKTAGIFSGIFSKAFIVATAKTAGLALVIGGIIKALYDLSNAADQAREAIERWDKVTEDAKTEAEKWVDGLVAGTRELDKMVEEANKLKSAIQELTAENERFRRSGGVIGGVGGEGIGGALGPDDAKRLENLQKRLGQVQKDIARELKEPGWAAAAKEAEKMEDALRGLDERGKIMVKTFQDAGWSWEEARNRFNLREWEKTGSVFDDATDKVKKFTTAIRDLYRETTLRPFLGGDIAKQLALGTGGLGPLPLFPAPFDPDAWKKELADPFSVLSSELRAMGEAGLGPLKVLEDAREEAEKGEKSYQRLGRSLRDVSHLFQALGIDATSSIARIISGTLMLVEAFDQLSKRTGEGLLQQGDYFGAIQAGVQGIAGVLQATASGSKGARMLGGALHGAAAGAQIAGPWGAVGGAIAGAIVGAIRKKARWEVVAEDSAKLFGKAFSEELSKQIAASEKVFKDFGLALSANIGDVIAEVGITAENFAQVWGHLFLLFDKTKEGVIDFATANEQATKSFGPMIDHLRTMGQEGSLRIGEVVKRMRELGLATQEVTAHMEEQGQKLMDSMAPALEFVSNLEDMTAEEAKAFSGVVAAAWAGAVAATGSFIGAVQTLGEEFESALRKIMDSLGPSGANLVGPIASVYNIIKNNQEAFNALQGIVSGLDAMAQMGILTQGSLSAMGEAVKATFDRILAKTGNMTAALRASWPELVKLYNWFVQLGMDVPPWLDELIGKGQEMGLSMEIPLSTQEALNRIVEILNSIAIALGAVEQSAVSAASAIGSIPKPPSPVGGGGPNGDALRMQEGGYVAGAPPHGRLAVLGEREGEFVIPESDMASIVGGGGDINIGDINFHVAGGLDPNDARVFADKFVRIVRDNIGNARSEMIREVNRG